MNVLLAVVVMLAAFFSAVILTDLFPWTKETAGRSDGTFVSRNAASTELQSRMTSFLMRSSAADIPMDNEFVIASRSSATKSYGLVQLINSLTYF